MYQSKAQDLTINKVRLFSQYNDHKRNYKPVNDMCFSLILSQAILLLIISWGNYQLQCEVLISVSY